MVLSSVIMTESVRELIRFISVKQLPTVRQRQPTEAASPPLSSTRTFGDRKKIKKTNPEKFQSNSTRISRHFSTVQIVRMMATN